MRRVLTSLALIPGVVYTVLWGPEWLVYAVTALVACICYYEYDGIAGAYGFGSLPRFGYLAGLLLLVIPGQFLLLVSLISLASLTLAIHPAEPAKTLPRAALLVLGILYIFGCWKFAILLRGESPHWLFFALVLNWIGDGCGYYVGRQFGRHRLAPRISPGKSWEGAFASLAGSLVFGFFYLRHFLPEVTPLEAIGLTALANLAGQLGDLSESAVKRGAGLKDSGTILPGHGGFLDRVDGTLFALPVIYLWLRVR